MGVDTKRPRFSPWVRKISWRGHGNPPSILAWRISPMDRGAWWAVVHRVPQTWTQLRPLSMHAGTSCICSICHIDRNTPFFSSILSCPRNHCKNMISSLECLWQSGTSQPCFLFIFPRFWSVADQSHHDPCLRDSNGPTPSSTTESLQGVY